jgi:hypothetical protein
MYIIYYLYYVYSAYRYILFITNKYIFIYIGQTNLILIYIKLILLTFYLKPRTSP